MGSNGVGMGWGGNGMGWEWDGRECKWDGEGRAFPALGDTGSPHYLAQEGLGGAWLAGEGYYQASRQRFAEMRLRSSTNIALAPKPHLSIPNLNHTFAIATASFASAPQRRLHPIPCPPPLLPLPTPLASNLSSASSVGGRQFAKDASS